MIQQILYLTYSDIKGRGGLLFPQELQPNTYSPGIWVFERLSYSFPLELVFNAVDNNQVQSLMMKYIGGNTYHVFTEKYGSLFFRALKLSEWYNKYVGNNKNIKSFSTFYQVIPVNTQKLEKLCIESGFFFVGATDM